METDIHIIENPKYLSTLYFAGGENGVNFSFTKPRPNFWWRFWQYICFGFVWKAL